MLSKILARNFLSWKDLEFNVSSGATLVDGWNEDDQRSEGSGKSAVLNALCWAIYGKLPKDVNIDDVVKDGESGCQVGLVFSNGDSIVRSRKPNELYLIKNLETVKGKDARETQTLIEEYVGCNFETFCQSVYFAQNYDKKFLSSNQEDKGKILSSIQNLQVFDKARKETMDLIKLEESKITTLKNQTQVLQNNVNNLTSQKGLVESFISDKIQKHKQQVAMLTQQRDLLSGHLKSTTQDIERITSEILLINLDALSNDEQELNQAKTEYSTKLSDLNYQYSQLNSIRKAILSKENEGNLLAKKYETLTNKKQSLTSIETTHTYRALLANKKQASEVESRPSYVRLTGKKKELDAYILNPTKICPSCGSELKNIDLSHTQKELDVISREMSSLMGESASEIQRIDQELLNFEIQFKNDAEGIDSEMENILSQLQGISDYLDQNKVPSIGDLNVQSSEVKNVIKQIDQALFETNQKKLRHAQLSSQHGSLVTQLSNYTQQHAQFEYSLTQLGQPDVSGDYAKLGVLQSELTDTSVKLAEVTNLIDVSSRHSINLETLKDGFKEIKSFVFTNALNELNFRTNQYLNELFEVEANIKFSNEDQKIESKITLGGRVRSLGLLSGGQNRRFNLAVDLALADIVSYRKNSKLNLLVFDEYFKDLSEISMEKSLDLLKSRKSPVILIEHNSIFKNIVDKTFFVRLESGTSRESRQ